MRKLRRDQVDFFGKVVVASRTKGERNREIPMDVLDDRVKPILMKLCENKKADEFVFINPRAKSLTPMSKGHSVQHATQLNSETSNGMISEPHFERGRLSQVMTHSRSKH